MNAQQEALIHGLWDDLADFDLSQPEAAVAHVLAFLTQLTGLSNATWAGAVRMAGVGAGDPLQGWRVSVVKALYPLQLEADAKLLGDVLKAWERREVDPSFLLPLKAVGQFRAYSLRRDLPEAWFDTPFYARHYGAFGVHDVVFVAFPLSMDCESHFGFYAREPVTDETIALLTYALRGIKWFHCHVALTHGLLLASSPLTQTEHKVLQLLLTGATESSVAREIGLARSTTHQHVVTIFRKFGVNSRAQLMSLWLSTSGAAEVDGENSTPTI